MPDLVLDHLVVGAASLDQGVAYLRQRLGVELPFGGAHPRMGTHNCLTRIGDGVFLEIIAIDPDTAPPARPRWFALDDPAQRRRLAEMPRPIAWVAGSSDLRQALRTTPILGSPATMTRRDLSWLIGIRDDGALPEGGVLPSLIQWPAGPHPSDRMADLGIRLDHLRLWHPDPSRIGAVLATLGGRDLVHIGQAPVPSIEANLRLPNGQPVTLA